MFDHFSKEKSDFLNKKDKSKKGHVDEDAVVIIDEINSKKDYYTTSSCAGRIVLLEMKSKKKNECGWIFAKHDKINFTKLNNSLNQYKNNKININKKIKNQIWFKQQPTILHVACRNIEAAKKLLDEARKIFKHSGIIGVTDKKIAIEIIGSERIETIISDKNFAADEYYIKQLVNYANKNFVENKRKTERLLSLIRKI